MERVEEAVADLPLRRDVVQKAFERFRTTGELPAEQRLAVVVAEQALHGGAEVSTGESRSGVLVVPPAELERFQRLMIMRRSPGDSPEPEGPSVRECLLDEAVHAHGIIREGARVALKVLVGNFGGDITDAGFLADRTLPDHAGIGLHLLGYPERLAKRPYVRQARRLFARLEDLRKRIDQDDPAWFDRLEAAISDFREQGHLPQNELLLEAVLADAEFDGLWRHAVGENVSDLMAALDTFQQSRGRDREQALEDLFAIVTCRASHT